MADPVDETENTFRLKPLFVFAAIMIVLGAALSFLQLPMFRGAAMIVVMPALMFGVPALLVWLVLVMIRLLLAGWRRRWRTAAAQAVILILVPPITFAGFYIGPYVHFALSYPYYALQVRLSPDGGASPIHFSWGGAGAGSSQTDRWLIYDPTAQALTRPPETDEEGSSAWYEAEHLIGHFYLVERYQGAAGRRSS